jgi:hypothetical protein
MYYSRILWFCLAWWRQECFQAAKNETGLNHYQVRRYDAWYRCPG